MSVLERIEKEKEKLARKIDFEVEYIPGVTTEFDKYKATHPLLDLTCYGTSESAVVNSAVQELTAQMIGYPAVESRVKKIIQLQKISS